MVRYALAGALIVAGLLLAFMFGRNTAASDRASLSSRAGATPSSGPADVQAAEERAAQEDRIQQLEKQLAALKKENAELTADKKDLQSKLSIAAYTVNKQQIEIQEWKRRAEEAEWKARQSNPSGAPIPAVGARSP